ncbi:hypothetical protein SPFM12_00075 [Salmonella phage SPFM12]|nr:hypothetical protein SPFM12_00075 [Salmonella phage SPFM12]
MVARTYGFERMLEAHREMCTGASFDAAKEAYSTARIYHLALPNWHAEAHHWTRGKEAYEHKFSILDSDRTAERIAYAFGLDAPILMNAFAQCDIPPGKYRKWLDDLGNVKMVITMRGPDFERIEAFSGTTPLPEALWAAKKQTVGYWEGKGDPEYAPSEKACYHKIDPNDAKAKEIFYIDPYILTLANVAFDVPTMKMIGSLTPTVVVGTDLETLALRPDAIV